MADAASEGEQRPTSLAALLESIFLYAASMPSDSGVDNDSDPAVLLLRDIQRAAQLADSLSLYSNNDFLRDLPTFSLRSLFIHSVWAEVSTRIRTKPSDVTARKGVLQTAKAHYDTFIKLLYDLEILPVPASSSSQTSQASGIALISSLLKPYASSNQPSTSSEAAAPIIATNPHQRRELKVALFKLERTVRKCLDEYRKAKREKFLAAFVDESGLGAPNICRRTGSSAVESLEGPYNVQWDLLVLPKGKQEAGDEGEEDEEDEMDDSDRFISGTSRPQVHGSAVSSSSRAASESGVETPTSLRSYLVLLLHLHALLAYNNLAFIKDELSLLGNIPASAQRDAAERQAREEAEAERRRRRVVGMGDEYDLKLESRFDAGASGPLLNDKGKPLRPFTITSAKGGATSRTAGYQVLPTRDLNERQHMHDAVFQPSHRLPTMSIDEYLEEEARRGNILTGGGAQVAAKATPTKTRASRSEMDGTQEAEEAREEARQEIMYWDEFKESNKRGAGNTMNRG